MLNFIAEFSRDFFLQMSEVQPDDDEITLVHGDSTSHSECKESITLQELVPRIASMPSPVHTISAVSHVNCLPPVYMSAARAIPPPV